MSKAEMIMALLEDAFAAGEDLGFRTGRDESTDYQAELQAFLKWPAVQKLVYEVAEME